MDTEKIKEKQNQKDFKMVDWDPLKEAWNLEKPSYATMCRIKRFF
jgi:hypothetical protein